jgi:RNA polymerase sigma-19 factor, ECF subfamily
MAVMSDPIANVRRLPGIARSAAERYVTELRRYLLRRLGGPQDVEDLVQEVYLKLLTINPEIRVEKPLAFIFHVAALVLANHRSGAALDREVLTYIADQEDMEKSPAIMERVSEALSDRLEESLIVHQQLEQALQRIPPKHAAILLMAKRDGMTYAEIAAELGLSAHSVHKYLQEALAQLRRQRWVSKGD